MKIEKATVKDVPNLLKYLEVNEKVTHLDFFRKRIKYYIGNSFILLAKESKNIVGHLFFQVKENINLGVGEIETVNINENYRRRGIGTKLVKQSIESGEEYFKNNGIELRCIYLMTRSNNIAAIKMYEKAGFKKKNTIGKIYRDDQPEELIMERFF